MAGDSDDVNMSTEKPSCVERMRCIVKSYIDKVFSTRFVNVYCAVT